MKKLIMAVVLVFGIAPILLADWSGFWGYVTYEGDPVSGAYVEVKKTDNSFCDTVRTDANGYYYCACFSGYYSMKAWEGERLRVKLNQYNNGQPGGVQVDFELEDMPKK